MKQVKTISAICIIINVISISLVFLLKNNLPPVVPLFYGLPVSASQLIPSNLLILPSLISITLIFINLVIVKFTKDSFLQKILSGLNITITILPLITILEIIFLVGNI